MAGSSSDNPGVVIPPPTYSLVAVGLGYFLNRHWPWPLDFPHTELVASLMLAAGLFLMSWAALGFHHYRTTILPHKANSALIQQGAFRYSRNPVYLSFLLMLAAVAFAAANTWLLVLVPANWLCLHWRVIPKEEAYLIRFHGDLYRQYCHKVRRWL